MSEIEQQNEQQSNNDQPPIQSPIRLGHLPLPEIDPAMEALDCAETTYCIG